MLRKKPSPVGIAPCCLRRSIARGENSKYCVCAPPSLASWSIAVAAVASIAPTRSTSTDLAISRTRSASARTIPGDPWTTTPPGCGDTTSSLR